MKTYAVTGEFHGSIVEAFNEWDARWLFNNAYAGERILTVKDISNQNLSNL